MLLRRRAQDWIDVRAFIHCLQLCRLYMLDFIYLFILSFAKHRFCILSICPIQPTRQATISSLILLMRRTFLHTQFGVLCAAVSWGTVLQLQKVVGSIPDGVIRIFRWYEPSSHTMALGSAQPPTQIRLFPGADQLTTFMCQLPWNLRELTSWKPQGLYIKLFFSFLIDPHMKQRSNISYKPLVIATKIKTFFVIIAFVFLL